MDKVYLIHIDEVYEYEELGHPIEVYRNREDAENRYKEIVEVAECEYPSDWEREEGQWRYECYEDGHYAYNHFSVTLKTAEVR